MAETDLLKHKWIPECLKISEEEKEELLQKYNIDRSRLSYILITDPAIRHLKELKVGDVIQVRRPSLTAKETIFYRVVVNG